MRNAQKIYDILNITGSCINTNNHLLIFLLLLILAFLVPIISDNKKAEGLWHRCQQSSYQFKLNPVELL